MEQIGGGLTISIWFIETPPNSGSCTGNAAARHWAGSRAVSMGGRVGRPPHLACAGHPPSPLAAGARAPSPAGANSTPGLTRSQRSALRRGGAGHKALTEGRRAALLALWQP